MPHLDSQGSDMLRKSFDLADAGGLKSLDTLNTGRFQSLGLVLEGVLDVVGVLDTNRLKFACWLVYRSTERSRNFAHSLSHQRLEYVGMIQLEPSEFRLT